MAIEESTKDGIDKNYCTLYLVRHGEAEWNAKHIIMGQKDSPLTQKGIGEAKTMARVLSDIQFNAIFSSDSPRAQRTAEIVKLLTFSYQLNIAHSP